MSSWLIPICMSPWLRCVSSWQERLEYEVRDHLTRDTIQMCEFVTHSYLYESVTHMCEFVAREAGISYARSSWPETLSVCVSSWLNPICLSLYSYVCVCDSRSWNIICAIIGRDNNRMCEFVTHSYFCEFVTTEVGISYARSSEETIIECVSSWRIPIFVSSWQQKLEYHLRDHLTRH